MFEHTKVYTKHFSIGPNEHHYCEICGKPANGGIHHIDGRGKDMNVIENLMGICMEHHEWCEASTECNQYAKKVHERFLMLNPYQHPDKWDDRYFRNNLFVMKEYWAMYKSRK